MIETQRDYDRMNSEIDNYFDSDWLKSSFMLSDLELADGDHYEDWVRINRYTSTATNKFTSTSPGMAIAVNPKPQFTRYADIRDRGKLFSRPERITPGTEGHPYGLGMGRYYSEAIDDNQQRIYLRFGTEQYMSLLMWMTMSFDVHKAALQGRGVITSTLLEAINVGTKLFAIIVNPVLFAGKLLMKTILQPNKFVSVKDDMATYWATVENILNSFVVRRSMVPFFDQDAIEEPEDEESGTLKKLAKKVAGAPDAAANMVMKVSQKASEGRDNEINQELRPSKSFVTSLNELIPDVIDPETGRIRVQAIALRGQAAFNKMMIDDMNKPNPTQDLQNRPLNVDRSHDTYFLSKDGTVNIGKKLFGMVYDMWSSETDGDAPTGQTINPYYTDVDGKAISPVDISVGGESSEGEDTERSGSVEEVEDSDLARENLIAENAEKKQNIFDKFGDYFFAQATEGAAFAIFNVNNTGAVSESFSNSTASNPIESVFNAISSKARNIMGNLGHIKSIPILGDAIGLATDAAAITISNATLGLANPLLALAYGATISLPKRWESSDISMPKASYSLKLISPYGNAYSQLFNIYLPLSMIMAGGLPRKTGLDSHTAPPLVQLYDRGRVNIHLGIIDSINVTRGTSNLAFTRGGHPNAIDVDFSIANLNEFMAIDVTSSGFLTRLVDAFDTNLSDDNFTNYVNTVVGMDVYHQYYSIPAASLKLAERAMVLKTLTSPHASDLASFTVNTVPFAGPVLRSIFGNNAGLHRDLQRR